MSKYNVSPELLARIKKAAKYAKVDWKSVAARPASAEDFVVAVEQDIIRQSFHQQRVGTYKQS